MSLKSLWTICFLRGNDHIELMSRNLREVFEKFKRLHGTEHVHENSVRKIVGIFACDMSTHDSATEKDHMTCFRCGEAHSTFREIFVVEDGNGRTLEEIARDCNCFVSDLIDINSGDLVSPSQSLPFADS